MQESEMCQGIAGECREIAGKGMSLGAKCQGKAGECRGIEGE